MLGAPAVPTLADLCDCHGWYVAWRRAAKVTIRTVPNQTSTVVESTLLSHVKRVFEARRSFNRLTARVRGMRRCC